MSTMDLTDLTHMGRQSQAPIDQVGTVPWQGRGPITVRLDCAEFTSLCPVTGQPDFAELVIEYEPAQRLIETKSPRHPWAETRSTGSDASRQDRGFRDRGFRAKPQPGGRGARTRPGTAAWHSGLAQRAGTAGRYDGPDRVAAARWPLL